MALHINDVLDKVREAQTEFDNAKQMDDLVQQHVGYRLAYGCLSQAASDAYMIYSSKPKSSIFSEGGTSTWAREELGTLTRILGAQYSKQGAVGSARMEQEFDRWVVRVRQFINKLNEDFHLDSGQVKAKDWKEDELKRKAKLYEDFNQGMFGRDGSMSWPGTR